MGRWLRQPLGLGLIFSLLFSVGVFFGFSESFSGFEELALDWQFRNRPEHPPFPKDIALVEINDESVLLRKRWPWGSEELRQLLKTIWEQEPKVVAIALPFLRDFKPSNYKDIEKFFDEFEKFFLPKKEKKANNRRRRWLSRAQRKRLEEEKKRREAILKFRDKYKKLLLKDPLKDELYPLFLKNKNKTLLGYLYYRNEKDVPGVDGYYFKKLQSMKGKGDKKKGKKSAKKNSKFPDIWADPADFLFHLKSPAQMTDSSLGFEPAVDVYGMRINPVLGQAVWYHGFANIPVPTGKTVHKLPLFIRKGEKIYPSFALAAYIAFTGDEPGRLVVRDKYSALLFGDTELPLTEDGQFRINYYGPRSSIPKMQRFAAGDIVKGKGFTTSDFKGKIVLIGLSSSAEYQIYPTPFESNYSALELHATLLANLLQKTTIYPPEQSKFSEFLLLLLSGIVLAVALQFLGSILGLFVLGALIFVLHSLQLFVFFPGSSQIYLFYADLSLVAIFFLTVWGKNLLLSKRQKQIFNYFSTRLEPQRVKAVVRDPSSVEGGDKPVEVAALSFKLSLDFDSVEGDVNAKQLKKLTAHLSSSATDSILKKGGFLAENTALSITAFYNIPFPLENYQQAAAESALQIALEAGNTAIQWESESLPPVKFSVGLDAGPGVAGNFGEGEILTYSFVGRPAVFSQFLAELGQIYGAKVLVSPQLFELLNPTGRFLFRELDLIRRDGGEPFAVYELVSSLSSVSGLMHEAVQYYAHALQLYRKRQFAEAAQYFGEALRRVPEDGPSKLMLQRCEQYKSYPPPFDWDGSWKVSK